MHFEERLRQISTHEVIAATREEVLAFAEEVANLREAYNRLRNGLRERFDAEETTDDETLLIFVTAARSGYKIAEHELTRLRTENAELREQLENSDEALVEAIHAVRPAADHEDFETAQRIEINRLQNELADLRQQLEEAKRDESELTKLVELYPEFDSDLDENGYDTGFVTCPFCDKGGSYDIRRKCPPRHADDCPRLVFNLKYKEQP